MEESRAALRGPLLCPLGALLSVVMPGAGHWAIDAKFRPAVLAAAITNIVAMLTLAIILRDVGGTADLAAVAASRPRFIATGLLLLVLAVTRLWAALDVAWRSRPDATGWVAMSAAVAAVAITIGGVVPIAVAANYVRITDKAVAKVFRSHDAVTAEPGIVETTTTLVGGTTVPAEPGATSTTVEPFAGVDRVNVLLLGGDAGPGRFSLRTDSMITVSIDPKTGDTAMISIPRNVQHLPFPPGTDLAKQFPHGFDGLANAIYPYVNSRRALYGGGDDAAAQAVKLGMAQFLGVPIQYYVLVDMKGFVDVVDALGGIDINVIHRVPSAGNPGDAKHRVPAFIDVGKQHMDGTLALDYARTRHADSDYKRMARQRCVLAAISESATPRALATGLPSLLDAFGNAVQTDLPRSRLNEFALLVDRYNAHGGAATIRSLQLTPPLIEPANWNAKKVRQIVADALHPKPAPPAPTSTTSTVAAKPGATTTSTIPGPVLVADECSPVKS